ncbi:GTP cyclohydrolase FolE2 [Acinetobacter baretiae]|uniref:GTP cyclohydrolase FolE2 n=1 Tax=Acinetobacter baretiae TaxID=2605383 RepID=UPI001BB401C9|nr:GTP cyclohydrolase FolE2 [Acinetobacter baretiae]
MINLPDISKQQEPQYQVPLNWVGMEKISLPLTLNHQTVLSDADIYINLPNAQVKGIHMSRVYLQLQQLTTITACAIKTHLHRIIQTHQKDQTNQARLNLHFKLPIQHQALKTPIISGWKAYPIYIQANLNQDTLTLSYTIHIEYSSTCPCSAALSRHMIQDQFDHDFKTAHHIKKEDILHWISKYGSQATPHSQRSTASVTIHTETEINLYQLIQNIENTLQTATQTAVKRADEQAFAQRNGENLMFVEDAARRIGQTLKTSYSAWSIKVTHYESLHSHNAVAYLDHTIG